MCSLMVTLKVGRISGRPYSLKLFDISRAHFYCESKRRVFVTLPEGDEEEGCCALLKRTMYGTQDASAIWQGDYAELLLGSGFKHGSTNSYIFYQPEWGVRVLVHGDDIVQQGPTVHGDVTGQEDPTVQGDECPP